MATIHFEKVEGGIELEIENILSRGRSPSSYMNRYLYPKYINAQIERWQTENSSQGDQWEPLNPEYAKRKKKKFAAYPGAGNAIMVATGRLAAASQGRDNALKIVTDDYIQVGVDAGALPYAVYPGEIRPFMEFSDETVQDWVDGLASYIMTGEIL